MLLPFVLSLFDAGGIATAGLPAVAAVLLRAPLALLGAPARWLAAVAPLALTLAVVGLVVDRPDTDRPQRADLAYLLDADTGVARWISRDLAPAPWTATYVPAGAVAGPGRDDRPGHRPRLRPPAAGAGSLHPPRR